MTSNKMALLVIAAALITSVVQAVIYGPQLPDTVASHFGGNGQADGSMGREAFLGLMLGLQFGLAAMMVGLGYLMIKLPPSLLNIPNKEYWLHDDRREETIEYNKRMLNWIAAITAILLVATFQLAIQANMGNGDRTLNMPVFIVCMVAYLVVVFGMTIRMMMRFSQVPAKEGESEELDPELR